MQQTVAMTTTDLLVLTALAVLAASSSCSGMRLRLSPRWLDAQLLRHPAENKRTDNGNHCPPDMPFPCKTSAKCIPMNYLCDDNIDCDDGYDENMEVCTAAHRPAVDQIQQFLESQSNWIAHSLFNDKSTRKVANALAVSRTLDDFKSKLGLTDVKNLQKALHAVQEGSEEVLSRLGMPPAAWGEVDYIFSKLVNSGFLNN